MNVLAWTPGHPSSLSVPLRLMQLCRTARQQSFVEWEVIHVYLKKGLLSALREWVFKGNLCFAHSSICSASPQSTSAIFGPQQQRRVPGLRKECDIDILLSSIGRVWYLTVDCSGTKLGSSPQPRVSSKTWPGGGGSRRKVSICSWVDRYRWTCCIVLQGTDPKVFKVVAWHRARQLLNVWNVFTFCSYSGMRDGDKQEKLCAVSPQLFTSTILN